MRNVFLLVLFLVTTTLRAQNVAVLARPNGDLVTPTNFFKNLVKGSNLKAGTGVSITQSGTDYYFSAGDFTALFNTNQFSTNTLISIKSGASLTNLLIFATNTFGDAARLVFGSSGEFYADLKDTGGLPGSGGSVTYKNKNGDPVLELNINKICLLTNTYFSNLTSSRVLVLDAYNRVISSDITTTELETLDNITGNIQNQLNVLQATNVNLTGWSNVETNSVLYKSLLTAKGDLITYAVAPVKLSVGTNGQVLTVDSSDLKGVAWKTPTNLTAVDNYTLTNTGAYILVDTNVIATRAFASNQTAVVDLSGYALLIGTNVFTGTNTFNGEVFFNSNVWLGSIVADTLTVIYSIGVASGGTGTNTFNPGYVYSTGGTNPFTTTTNIIAVVTNEFQQGSLNLTNLSSFTTNQFVFTNSIGTTVQPYSTNLSGWSLIPTNQLGAGGTIVNTNLYQWGSQNLTNWSLISTNDMASKAYADSLLGTRSTFYLRADQTVRTTNYLLSSSFDSNIDTTQSVAGVTLNQYIFTFESTNISLSRIQDGSIIVDFDARISGVGGPTLSIKPEVYLLTNGVSYYEFPEASSVALTTTKAHYRSVVVVQTNTILLTNSQIAIKLKATAVSGTTTAYIYTGSNSVSSVELPVVVVASSYQPASTNLDQWSTKSTNNFLSTSGGTVSNILTSLGTFTLGGTDAGNPAFTVTTTSNLSLARYGSGLLNSINLYANTVSIPSPGLFSTSKIMVNTTNNVYALNVNGSGTFSSGYLLIYKNGITDYSNGQLTLLEESGSANLGRLSLGFSSGSDFGFIQAVDPGVAVRNVVLQPLGGLVGIGTSTPSATLHVNGTVLTEGLTTVKNTLTLGGYDAGNPAFTVTTISNLSLAKYGSGNLQTFNIYADTLNLHGISVIDNKLKVGRGSGESFNGAYHTAIIGERQSYDGVASLLFNPTTNTVGTNSGMSIGYSTTAQKMYWTDWDNPTIRMTLTKSGNLGIGTDNPSAKLHVNGSSRVDGDITVTGMITNSSNIVYTLNTPTPSSATNFVFDFGKAVHYYNMTNHVNFTSSTNRPAEGFEIFTTFTMINRSGSNLNVSFPTNWISLGNPSTVCTNGKSLMISATAIGSSETNVIYGAAN